MTRIERMDAALRGEPVDRIPISFWRYFHLRERDPALLADALLAFQRRFGWDFVKVNNRGSYYVEDWGNRYSYSDDPHTLPSLTRHAVHSREDWAKIEVLNPFKAPAYREQLVLLELMKEGLQDENVYFLQTLFSPLSIAFRLVGHSTDRLLEAMRDEPAELRGALSAIAQTLADYATACLNAGASGIFYAVTKPCTASAMSEDQYVEFGVPYDLRVLSAVRDRPGFNALHICGEQIFFDRMVGYPVDALSWDAMAPGNPSLREGRDRSGKAVMGGLDEKRTLVTGTPEQVAEEVRRGIQETGGRGYVIAPGCNLTTRTPPELLEAALAAL